MISFSSMLVIMVDRVSTLSSQPSRRSSSSLTRASEYSALSLSKSLRADPSIEPPEALNAGADCRCWHMGRALRDGDPTRPPLRYLVEVCIVPAPRDGAGQLKPGASAPNLGRGLA